MLLNPMVGELAHLEVVHTLAQPLPVDIIPFILIVLLTYGQVVVAFISGLKIITGGVEIRIWYS